MTYSAQTQLQVTLLNRFLSALESGQDNILSALILEAHPVDMAYVLKAVPPNQREAIWSLVPTEIGGAILQELDDEIRTQLLEPLEVKEVVELTKGLDTDDFADVLQDIPGRVDEILLALDEDRRKRLQAVLSFPEDVAGGVMDLEVITVRSDVTVSVVRRYLRQLKVLPSGTDKLFVIDRGAHFLGHVTLSSLLVNEGEVAIKDVMKKEVPTVTAEKPVSEVADVFIKLDLLSIAVVDEKNKLIGRITVDDIVDYIREAGQRQLMSLHGTVREDTFAPIIQSTRRRAVWLGVNLLTAFLAAWIIGVFEPTIEKLTALAVLMPIVVSMGGIAGSQTLALVIRSLSLGELQGKSTHWVLRKEILIAILNGLLWSLLISVIVWFWFDNILLSITIGSAVVVNLIVAAASGVFIPLFLNRLGVDPAIAGGVILFTVTDVVGFIAFLGLATIWIL